MAEIRGELFSFDGFIKEVTKDINSAVDRDIYTLHNNLVDLLEDIKQNWVPIEYGDLRDSGYVSTPMVGTAETVIAIGFTEPYATIQHERLDYYHPHGQAKYLEVPLERYYNSTR